MDRPTAERIKQRGESAIRELHSILVVENTQKGCTSEEFDALRRGIGLAMGIIDTELLSIVYRQYPELDPIE